jgi:hypothetical protein
MGGTCSTCGKYEKCIQNFRKSDGKNGEEDPGVNETIILKWSLKIKDVRLCLIDSGEGPMAGSCKHGKKSSVPIKSGEFLSYLSTKDSVLLCY